MNAQQEIRTALKDAYDDGRVNAMEDAVDTGMTGWLIDDNDNDEDCTVASSLPNPYNNGGTTYPSEAQAGRAAKAHIIQLLRKGY